MSSLVLKVAGDQGLCFASGEDSAAVGSGQNSGFDPDFADFVEGAGVGTALLVDYLLAEDALAQRFVILREFLLGYFVFFIATRRGQLGGQALLDVLDQRVAFRLGMLLGVERVCHFGADFFLQIAVVRVIEHGRLDFALGLADFIAQLVDRGADFLDLGVAELDRVDDRLFFDFLRARLDHHDAVGGSDDHDVDQASTHFVIRGIHDELSVDQANAHRADRAENGMSDSVSAHDAPLMPRTSGSLLLSADSTNAMIWVSHLNPSANMGRTGRSIWRLVSTSRSLMRPSRLMKPPGKRPPA